MPRRFFYESEVNMKAHEITTSEMKRLIYQVNKRMYRLEKAGAHEYNTTYENALAVISRGEKKQGKTRLTVSKNPDRLREQYMKALEITGSGTYEELSKSHIQSEIKKQKRRQALETDNEKISGSEKNRKGTFKESFGITNVDYATYNLLKSKDFKKLADALGSDVVLETIAPAINAGLGTSQLTKMIRDYMNKSQSDDQYYQNKLEALAKETAVKYS